MKRAIGTSLVLLLAGLVVAQQPELPKPPPEIAVLKKAEGTWEMTAKSPLGETKGTAVYKMELGGFWLASTVEMEMAPGIKFSGRGMDSYDSNKKKYVAVWFDSMNSSPLLLEGMLDPATKTMTMTGDGPGPDGKIIKHTIKTIWKDDDHFTFNMFHGESKESVFTIEYKRKK